MTQLVLRVHEWSQVDYVQPVVAGQTVAEMLRSVAGMGDEEAFVPLVVKVNGHPVPAELWTRVRPKAGTVITVWPDEIAGGSARQLVATAALITLAVMAPGWGTAIAASLGMGATAAAVISAGIIIAGSLAVNALIKPPSPEGGGVDAQRWNQLTGTSNQINPWGSVPVVIGESRFFPPHAAMPYTQSVGEKNYQICMFDLGHGDIDVSDIRVGDNPLSNFEGVQHEITRNPTLYTNDVSEQLVNADIGEFDEVTRVTAPNTEEISFDLIFPGGLFWRGTRPPDAHLRVNFEIFYRPTSGGAWLPLPANAQTSGLSGVGALRSAYNRTRTPFAVGARWRVTAGQYEVRIRRLAKTHPDDGRNTYVESSTWSVLRSIRHTNPSSTGTNKLVLRIEANDQVTGTLQTLSCLVRQRIRVYNRSTGTWSAPALNTNAAWVVWWLMTTCPALSTHVPAARMSLDDFADYAEFCAVHNLHIRMVLDSQLTARDLIDKVLAGAMGRLSTRDGRYSVVYDHGDPTPTAAFTSLEADNFRVSRVFTEVPHALRVQFRNVDADYQEDEIVVVADGHSYRGQDARGNPSSAPEATTFETLRVEQAMRSQQAWQNGRFHLAQAEFRQNTFTWDTDIAGLGTTMGDVVEVAHDVPEWGLGVGRVASLTVGTPAGAPGAATLKLDREVETEVGALHGVQFRGAAGGRVVVNCTPHAVVTDTFYLANLPAMIGRGDTAIIGVRGEEAVKVIITDVPAVSGDLNFSFTAVNYDARVAPYWANPPANIISEITGRDYGLPEPPRVIGVISNPDNDRVDDAGISWSEVHIGVHTHDNVPMMVR